MKEKDLKLQEVLERADAMLFALAELIKHQNREPHVSEEWFNIGPAELLIAVGEALSVRE